MRTHFSGGFSVGRCDSVEAQNEVILELDGSAGSFEREEQDLEHQEHFLARMQQEDSVEVVVENEHTWL